MAVTGACGSPALTCSSPFLGATSCCSRFLPRGAEGELHPGPGTPGRPRAPGAHLCRPASPPALCSR